ncbi:MAG: cytochrome c maturation protein CcmE [Chloroflexi bacterium]|nr:MAG: cytochrome c maturation protein CcmE [Chloroflexota bacterium]
MQEATVSDPRLQAGGGSRAKFYVGGLIILAAVAYLIVSSFGSHAEYFLTVEELLSRRDALQGRQVRVSGAVIGDSIVYDAQNLDLEFTIANVPGSNKEIEAAGGLAVVLRRAVNDPQAPRLTVRYHGPRPDLLKHEAQAIVTGTLGEDGIFYADELLLKCPTRYEEDLPSQAQG